ncbi:MAG: PorP/SprF family type IX secretion system membrane protein [Flavobacteriales bacterium]|jgi:type IX secretion system PorP/SprF family membrane protein
MKKNFILTVIVLMFSLVGISIKAQDFHLSQFDMLPLYYNPAQTGMYSAKDNIKYRFAGTYRSQWQKLNGKPYSAVGAGYDMKMKRFGAGLLLMNHIAGASNFDTFSMAASGAYQITDPKSKDHFLSTGFQIGLYQKKFSQRDLLFENQYNSAFGLDPTLPNGEDLPDMSILKFDASFGIFYKYTDKKKRFDPSIGLSLYHINRPNESFTGQTARLPMRFNGIFNCDVYLGEYITVTPSVLYMSQAKAREINAGIITAYKLQNTGYSVLGGAAVRVQDSVVLHLGMRHKNNTFRISYDIVTSDLMRYSGRRGGFEMGFIYCGK